MGRRVVISGMGVLSALGENLDVFTERLLSGDCGISRVQSLSLAGYRSKWGAEVNPASVRYYAPRGGKVSVVAQWVCHAVQAAMDQAGLAADEGIVQWRDAPLVLGTFLGRWGELEVDSIDGVMPSGCSLASVADESAWQLGMHGKRTTMLTACAAGAQAIAHAYDLIKFGGLDIVIAGGYEKLGQFLFAGMDAVRATSDGICPFGSGRKGTVLGEGAAAVVLESEASSLRRGARPLAEVAGYGTSSDAHHLLAPDPQGRGAAFAMLGALYDAGLGTEQIDYIHAHGTGTQLNDAAETTAIHSVFGSRARWIPVSSTKGSTGHTLGASGCLGAIASVMAIRCGQIPPTIGTKLFDDSLKLDHVSGRPRPARVRTVMANSFGFGGSNVALVLREYAEIVGRKWQEQLTAVGITGMAVGTAAGDNRSSEENVQSLNPAIHLVRFLVGRALEDSGIAVTPANDRRVGLVLGLADGCATMADAFLREVANRGPRGASAALFASSIPNAVLGAVTRLTGIRGIGCTLCTSEREVETLAEMSLLALCSGRANAVIVGRVAMLGGSGGGMEDRQSRMIVVEAVCLPRRADRRVYRIFPQGMRWEEAAAGISDAIKGGGWLGW